MTDTSVVKMVILFLGFIAVVLCFGTIAIAWSLIEYGSDATDVAILGVVASGFTGAVGFLGGLLGSTRSGDVAGEAKRQAEAQAHAQAHPRAEAEVEAPEPAPVVHAVVVP
jgi:hypothetical protein